MRLFISIVGVIWAALASYLAVCDTLRAFLDGSHGVAVFSGLVALVMLGYVLLFLCDVRRSLCAARAARRGDL